jgi:hypothetical protein
MCVEIWLFTHPQHAMRLNNKIFPTLSGFLMIVLAAVIPVITAVLCLMRQKRLGTWNIE